MKCPNCETGIFHILGDEIVCLSCSWYPDPERNQYVRTQQAKKHHNWHTCAEGDGGHYAQKNCKAHMGIVTTRGDRKDY